MLVLFLRLEDNNYSFFFIPFAWESDGIVKIMQWFMQGSLIGDNVAEVESSWPIAILCKPIFIIVLFTEPAANDLTFFN